MRGAIKMLKKILETLVKGGRYSNKAMASELGVDESLVEQMIDKLLQMKYIEKEKINSCSDGCGCCSNKGCSEANTHNVDINVWRVTEKGRVLISK
jgi:DNA-binding Lrp family transcriptional regulator